VLGVKRCDPLAHGGQASSHRLATAAAPQPLEGFWSRPHHDTEIGSGLDPADTCCWRCPCARAHPEANAMGFTKVLMSADLPEWWGARHPERMGNATTKHRCLPA
jgi:hypothetical protein